jgi:hypothetical protein
MSVFHSFNFMYMSYFFRLRRITMAPALLISGVYACFFNLTNNIGYKLIVDRKVIKHANRMGQKHHIQPTGEFKNRGLNYV